jgi:hypothetical protein
LKNIGAKFAISVPRDIGFGNIGLFSSDETGRRWLQQLGQAGPGKS